MLWPSCLIYCMFNKELLPSYHHKSVCWRNLSCFLKSTFLLADNSVLQSFSCSKFAIIENCSFICYFYYFTNLQYPIVKESPTFMVAMILPSICLSFVRRHCSMFRNVNFHQCSNQVFVDTFLSECLLQNLFWFFFFW